MRQIDRTELRDGEALCVGGVEAVTEADEGSCRRRRIDLRRCLPVEELQGPSEGLVAQEAGINIPPVNNAS